MATSATFSESLPHDGSRSAAVAPVAPVSRICIVGEADADADADADAMESLRKACLQFDIPVIISSNVEDTLLSNSLEETAFVLQEFRGPVYDRLDSLDCTIYGVTALMELASSGIPPFISPRPLFSHAMRGVTICFNGYRRKEQKAILKNFLFIIHSLGGRIKNEVNSQSVTHLVTESCRGEKYKYASTFEIPIMQDGWLSAAWHRRHQVGFVASDPGFAEDWKVKPFHGSSVYFHGFSDEEKKHMIQELIRNGGTECSDYKSKPCSHVVVDSMAETMPPDVSKDVHLVKAEWFWASIQMDACAEEKMHLLADHLSKCSVLSPRGVGLDTPCFSPNTPGSLGKRKKRRTEALRQLAQTDNIDAAAGKKSRNSLMEMGVLSPSADELLVTPENGTTPRPTLPPAQSRSPTSEIQLKTMSARSRIFGELVQTEENYVAILQTIVDVFQRPLEDPRLQLINQTQVKIIFGNIPPILSVHSKMLAELRIMLADWNDQLSIGKVILGYAPELVKVYPPFVNFFENVKQTLEACDRDNPRFHAFLKVCQGRPECGRQSLGELLIRPVQRLGSISLLLNDLLKHTRKERDHPDARMLEDALAKIKEVLTNINEDKRRTEGQVHIFNIFKDIENCPPHLVSSHRNFLEKVDVLELGGADELCGKGAELTLFLFTDVLEVSKKRKHQAKGLHGRSPSTMSLHNPSSHPLLAPRLHKHVDLMSLTSVRRVVDLIESSDCGSCFALVCRSNEELKERMFVFQVVTEELNKLSFLRLLCRNVANNMYRSDPEAYLVRVRPEDLDLSTADLSASKGLRSKVKKVFSFNKPATPLRTSNTLQLPSTPNRLKRAVSTMISPLTSRSRLSMTPGSMNPAGEQDLPTLSKTNTLFTVPSSSLFKK